MNHLTLVHLWILAPFGFLAAFIDASVGGGGIISLPALLLAGLPPAVALGTNKFAGTMSALTSTASYWRSGKVNTHLVTKLLPLSLVGSIAGALLVHRLPSTWLRPLVVVLLVAVALYTVLKKDIGSHMNTNMSAWRLWSVGTGASLVIGFYDGFFGPGTGAFLILCFVFIGFDFVHAAGNSKALNLASNAGALITFAFMKLVNLEYGLTLGITMVVGAYVGSKVAITKGVAYLRPVFILVTTFMIGQQAWALWGRTLFH